MDSTKLTELIRYQLLLIGIGLFLAGIELFFFNNKILTIIAYSVLLSPALLYIYYLVKFRKGV